MHKLKGVLSRLSVFLHYLIKSYIECFGPACTERREVYKPEENEVTYFPTSFQNITTDKCEIHCERHSFPHVNLVWDESQKNAA
jgi:hypothetical protein